MTVKKIIVGNWKMHGTLESARERVVHLLERLEKQPTPHQVVLCPSHVHLAFLQGRLVGSEILLGAQDCAPVLEGAYTGDTSPLMLKDIGCTHVILGHSERRQYHRETADLLKEKIEAAHRVGLKTIFCVGETLAQREAHQTLEVIEHEIRSALPSSTSSENTLIAYEPVWAIGTGKTPTSEEIEEVHGFLTEILSAQDPSFENIPLLYGGSVTSQNAQDFLSLKHVDGLLIGGASLKSDEFVKILTFS